MSHLPGPFTAVETLGPFTEADTSDQDPLPSSLSGLERDAVGTGGVGGGGRGEASSLSGQGRVATD